MGFLKKIRKNILNQDNSFHVGFQNRSPFSYTSQYSGDWVPPVQSLKQNPEGWIDPTLGGEWSKATTAAIKAVGDIGTAVVKNLIPSREEKEKKIFATKKEDWLPDKRRELDIQKKLDEPFGYYDAENAEEYGYSSIEDSNDDDSKQY